MGIVGALFGGWYTIDGIRFKHGTCVRIGGAYEHSLKYKGKVGHVVGRGEDSYRHPRRFLVDLGGMIVEITGLDLQLEEEARPKDDGSHWQ